MIIRRIVSVVAVVFAGTMLYAQQNKDVDHLKEEIKKAVKEEILAELKKEGKINNKKVEEKKDEGRVEQAIKDIYRRLDIGVKIYMDWTMKWGQKDGGSGAPYGNATSTGSGSGAFNRVVKGGNGATLTSSPFASGQDYSQKNNNGFNISRAYLDVKYKINDILTARMTSDVDAAVSGSADSNPALHFYLKYAYLDAKKDFGPVWLSATGGMIETLMIGMIDKISDYRWIAQNYIDQSKNVLNGNSLDNSADLGVKVSFGVMKYLTLSGAFTNGSGYKANEANSYKAVSYVAIVNPMKEIHIYGFGRNEITNKYDFTGKKTKREYYGYGVAYMSDLVKIGFNHVFPYVTTVGLDYGTGGLLGAAIAGNSINAYPLQRRGFMLLDSWLNFNLGAVVPEAPLLVNARFVYGLQRGTYQRNITDPELGKSRETFTYGLGLGWAFNKNFRIMIGGEIQKYFVNKNRILSYTETPTASPNYYNASALGAGQIFVGSRNPHDTKRLYIKAEVVF
jgi:hypothetical protein